MKQQLLLVSDSRRDRPEREGAVLIPNKDRRFGHRTWGRAAHNRARVEITAKVTGRA